MRLPKQNASWRDGARSGGQRSSRKRGSNLRCKGRFNLCARMWGLRLALDATYSVDKNPTGVGVYSREILRGLAKAHPDVRWLWCYRAHRLIDSFRDSLPSGCSRRPLGERYTPSAELFHGLNQRLPDARMRRAVATFHD